MIDIGVRSMILESQDADMNNIELAAQDDDDC